MAQVSLTINVDDKFADAALMVLATSTSPAGLSVFLAGRARNWLQERAEARFADAGDDASGPWRPLAESTQHIRSRLGFGADAPINVRTGFLKGTITAARGEVFLDALGSTMSWPDTSISPEIEHRYNQAQLGNLRTKAPARPVVAMNLTDAAGILALLGDFVLGPEMRSAMR